MRSRRPPVGSAWCGSSTLDVPKGIAILVVVCVSVLLTACQGFMQPTPPPTLTAVFLAGGAEAKVTQPAQAAETAIATPAASDGIPVSAAIVSGAAPTATVSPPRIMALGTRPSLVLRALPQPDAPVVITLPGSQVVWAEGRSSDGRWLRVVYGDAGARAWLVQDDVKL